MLCPPYDAQVRVEAYDDNNMDPSPLLHGHEQKTPKRLSDFVSFSSQTISIWRSGFISSGGLDAVISVSFDDIVTR